MAEETTKTDEPAEEAPRGPTRRVVLRRERVIVLPDGVDDEKLAEALKVLGVKGKAPDPRRTRTVDAWVVVGEFEGHSKQNAIEAHAGKPLTPDAAPGTYKAPTTTAWAGGRHYERPPKPKVEVRDID